MKIGIYDDVPEFNEMICRACKKILEKWSYNCDIAMYGSEGELMQEIYELDILLLDIKLSDGDGIEIKQKLERMGLAGTFRVAEAENRFDGRNGAVAALTLKPLE